MLYFGGGFGRCGFGVGWYGFSDRVLGCGSVFILVDRLGSAKFLVIDLCVDEFWFECVRSTVSVVLICGW